MQDWFLAYNGNFMVTLTLNTSKFLLIYRYLQNTYWFRAWSLSCHSFHAIKAFVLPWLSKRATPKAPRQCKYIESTIDNERQNRSKPMRAVYNTPHETFPLLCFWQSVWSCEVLMASKPKRTVTPYTVCMSAQPLPIGAFGMGIDVTKIILLPWKPLCLAGKVWF